MKMEHLSQLLMAATLGTRHTAFIPAHKSLALFFPPVLVVMVW